MLMADLEFTDSHVHFYDLSNPALRYEWLLPDAPVDPSAGADHAIRSQRYWADDFIAESRFHNVTKVVHVQAAIGIEDPVEETRWLQEFADRLGVPNGIVAYLDLTRDDVPMQLERHAAFANFRGIRDLRFDGYLENDRWRHGYAQLSPHRLVFCGNPPLEQMALARDLARSNPDVTLCIDHAGWPRQRGDDYFRTWRAAMETVAAAENAVIKISGLGMADHRWTVESLRPWVLACIEIFGTDRSFFGTNWPVDRLYGSYGDVVNAYAEITSGFTLAEQRALFSGNANRVFRLG
jgi:predicted TIM-barrel fold metal-dependent hydrolase